MFSQGSGGDFGRVLHVDVWSVGWRAGSMGDGYCALVGVVGWCQQHAYFLFYAFTNVVVCFTMAVRAMVKKANAAVARIISIDVVRIPPQYEQAGRIPPRLC